MNHIDVLMLSIVKAMNVLNDYIINKKISIVIMRDARAIFKKINFINFDCVKLH